VVGMRTAARAHASSGNEGEGGREEGGRRRSAIGKTKMRSGAHRHEHTASITLDSFKRDYVSIRRRAEE